MKRLGPMTRLFSLVTAVMLTLTLAACTPDKPGSTPSSPVAANVLRVLASSEVADIAPLLPQIEAATGVKVVLTESGTLDASASIANGEAAKAYDAAWLSSNRYLSLLDGGTARVATATKTMASPVLLGVRPAAAQRLGWSAEKPPSWADIQKAAAEGRFTYAMTNPGASNSGFSTLVAVATALTGGGSALDQARADQVQGDLKAFFSGQALTSGSTGWLTSKFLADPKVDGLFSYESTLLAMNRSDVTVIAPSDGVITADYPLSFLTGGSDAARAKYDKVLDWLKDPANQTKIMETTNRRPLLGGVKPDARFGNHVLIELPFPATRQVVDSLVGGYLNKVRKPSLTVYVLDLSGSMAGSRLNSLKQAMSALTTYDETSFVSFHSRETVVLLPFDSNVRTSAEFTVPEKDPQSELNRIKSTVDGYSANGGTAVFSSLKEAYEIIGRKNPQNMITSVVLLTDGESNAGLKATEFQSYYKGLSGVQRSTPTFTILFGEGSSKDLNDIATLTGGRVFDSKGDLASAFKVIRGYQ